MNDTSPEKLLIIAAINWWKHNRPVSFNEADHLENPTINCPTLPDKRLAQAVADYLEVARP